MPKKQSRWNCTWKPMTPENPDGYIVNKHVHTRYLRTKLSRLYKEKLLCKTSNPTK